MIKLARITTAAVVTTLLGTAGAASAHPGYGPAGFERGHHDGTVPRETAFRVEHIRAQLDELGRRVNRNDRLDRLSGREAAGLRRELREARTQLRWMTRDGIDHRELRQLQARVDRIRWQLHDARGDRTDRHG